MYSVLSVMVGMPSQTGYLLALAGITAVILYIRPPFFLMYLVHGDLLAILGKTRCPCALTLHTCGLSSAMFGGSYVARVGRWSAKL